MKYLPFIDTERLILRPITLDDAFEFFEMDSQPEVHHFLNNEPIESLDKILNIINSLHVQYDKYDIGRMAVIEKDTFEFIGWIGFKYLTENEAINQKYNCLDFGYRLRKEAWGKGYASEAAQACMKYYHNKLSHLNVYAFTHKDNIISKKILENVGFEIAGKFYFDQFNIDCNWFKLKTGSKL